MKRIETRKAERERIQLAQKKRKAIEKAAPDLLAASKDFLAGWVHFLGCIDFNHTFLDADAIRFMNEVPGKIEQAANKANTKL